MEYIKNLENKIKEYMVKSKGELQIKGWYYGANKNTSIKIGLKNNQLGGAYSCPRAEESIRGKIYIIWNDDRRSIAILQSNTARNFDKMVELWRRASYVEIEGADIYAAQKYPQVKLFDEEVNHLIYSDQDYLFELLDEYKNEFGSNGINDVNGSVSASSFQQYICNSKGLRICNRSTSFSTFILGDDIYGRSFISRKKICKPKKQQIIQDSITRINQLKTRIKISGGEMEVLLLPQVMESFIQHYLLNNLNGSNVVNKRSIFSLDNFNQEVEAIRKDMSLCINTITDYNQGSYISTFEGVPGGEAFLIKNGKLKTPILDLKHGKKANRKATPVPAGKGSIQFYSNDMVTLQEAIEQMDKGIIVCDLLGMHTQDPTSGNYSLTSPNSIYVENGRVIGGCKAVISGNIFKDLRSQHTKLGKINFEEIPFALIKSKVTGEK
ncbi:hypothetical protein F8154_02325 [Alkaliphilus pronyensis]|uniref:Metalloprotease TldD/E C-terminal domain-containing protein n=1 Tax=Alkaliphilus pronyensis TaxID=1482732 RepID=A0A6I0FF21_9FIRM|nr:metallopeptidase TldD-related protein [Alkaliphilus pronyensis]KAB3537836.1 hypothetical protein F8154_02325 [Alkaliphilus pronyensis]